MNFSIAAAIKLFRRKNKFRITAKLAEKTARSLELLQRGAIRTPDRPVEYEITSLLNGTQEVQDDFLTHLHKNSKGLKQASKSAATAQTYWHKHKFVQEYHLPRPDLNPQLEIYYRKLGLG